MNCGLENKTLKTGVEAYVGFSCDTSMFFSTFRYFPHYLSNLQSCRILALKRTWRGSLASLLKAGLVPRLVDVLMENGTKALPAHV